MTLGAIMVRVTVFIVMLSVITIKKRDTEHSGTLHNSIQYCFAYCRFC
jgi:hypothetical protein